MRVLVTGGAGYVGSVTVERLVETGHRVVVLDDLSTGHRTAVPPEARLVVGRYDDRDAVVALLGGERIDAVLHCAARSIVGESVAHPDLYYRENVVGGIAFLEALRAAGVGRLVLSSTAAVYGLPDVSPIPEDVPLAPDQPVWRDEADARGSDPLVRIGLRAPLDQPPVLQRRRCLATERRAARPGDASHPARSGRRRAWLGGHGVRH